MSSLYQAILPYQTRVIYLPHQPEAKAADPLECNLYVADILHPHFGGLGIRSTDDRNDQLVEFCALSYAWGSESPSRELVCNDERKRITTNLHQALSAMREQDRGTEFIWVDAICIDQDNEKEKAVQVSQMLQIFQQAKHVIAWLGDPGPLLEDVKLSMSLDNSKAGFATIDLDQVNRGLRWVYSAPWFERLWVQQELFASKSLVFMCGSHCFREDIMIHSPEKTCYLLIEQKRSTELSASANVSRLTRKRRAASLDEMSESRAELIEVLEKARHQLHCYRYFSRAENVDMVEAMLHTRTAKSSNPLDYVYGVLGLSRFPAKAMNLHTWSMAKDGECFVPIDYSSDLASLYCVLSRVLLFWMGLGLLAKFKVTERDETDGSEAKGSQLPSWVIDWRLTSEVVRPDLNPRHRTIIRKLDNAWDIMSIDCPAEQKFKSNEYSGHPKLFAWPPPPAHYRFCGMNDAAHRVDIRTLRLEGRICSQAIIDTKERTVKIQFQYARESQLQQISWQCQIRLLENDIVVSFPAFARADYTMSRIVSQSAFNGKMTRKPFVLSHPDLGTIPYASGGLWVLRPVQNDSFVLVSCLSMVHRTSFTPYELWKFNPEVFLGTNGRVISLMVKPKESLLALAGAMHQEPYQAIEALLGETRTFTIV